MAASTSCAPKIPGSPGAAGGGGRGYGPSSIFPPALRARRLWPQPLRGRRSVAALITAGPAAESVSGSRSAGFLEAFRGLALFDEGGEEQRATAPVTFDEIDGWMKESVAEIVRNIGEAPFLVHFFGRKDGVKADREAAAPGIWPRIKKRWERGSCPRPDGIALVAELEEMAEEEAEEEEAEEEEGSQRTWGLAVQGRGMECAACYVLRTCRVRSAGGFCTHFCLVRAQCFGEPLELQLRNAWLQLAT